MKLTLIAAIDLNNVIGKENKLPWYLPADLKRFKSLTTGNPIVMGRKTFESLGNKPLSNREHYILSKQQKFIQPHVHIYSNLKVLLKDLSKSEKVYVIGGAQIYKQLICLADILEITQIQEHFQGDSYFPVIDKSKWDLVSEKFYNKDKKNPYDFKFLKFIRSK